ncbi:MAG: F0F1 ATP synthase subunit delta [Bifidobacteriaceae bacterium]|jgi:F0F1-type ATP synthase delta subunit|nr:F0F1 ATP synthase subunit delta [Bifidobacteriaceae bacterium]
MAQNNSIRSIPEIIAAKELFIIAVTIQDNSSLGNFLSDFTHTWLEKKQLSGEVFQKASSIALDILNNLLEMPYTATSDLVDNIEDSALELIFDTAAKLGILDQIVYELNIVAHRLRDYPLLSEKLGKTDIDKEIRKAILDEFFANLVNPLTLMLMHHSTYALHKRNFVSTLFWLVSLITQKLNRTLVNVTVAVQPTDEQLARLESFIEKKTKKEVTFNIEIDLNILSGMKLEFDDIAIDGTTSSKISHLKRSIEKL